MSDSSEKPKKNPKSLIEQIEGLSFPKRAKHRKTVYLNEKLELIIKPDGSPVKKNLTLVDLSPDGVAFVDAAAEKSQLLKPQQTVSATFAFPKELAFTVTGKVMNAGVVRYLGKSYMRLGMQFAAEYFAEPQVFLASEQKIYFPCKGAIRPQASGMHPFFYEEKLLLQINGFTVQGIDLSFVSEHKFLIPEQRFVLQIFFPGRSTFAVSLKVHRIFIPGKKGLHFFATYDGEPSKEYRNALSEFLLATNEELTPQSLRSMGFAIGDLSQIYDLFYEKIPVDLMKTSSLKQSFLCLSEKDADTSSRQGRIITFRYKRHIACTATLLYSDSESSFYKACGYELPTKFTVPLFFELVEFYLNEHFSITDVLIPFLKQIICIVYQNGGDALVLEATTDLAIVLKKIGFKILAHQTLQREKKSTPTELLYLPIKDTVRRSSPGVIAEPVWDKIYKDLFVFVERFQRKAS